MLVNPVSFKALINTRETANAAAGRLNSTSSFLSKVTNIPQDKLLTSYNIDTLSLGVNYAVKIISQKYPNFNNISKLNREINITARKSLNPIDGNVYAKQAQNLYKQQNEEIEKTCELYGDTLDIPEIKIPFFKK